MELSVGQSIVENLDGATLTFDTLPIIVTIPCTFTPILKDFQMPNSGGGLSPMTGVAICLFRASLLDGIADDSIIKKGLHCIFTPGLDEETMGMQLWAGGLMPGAALYKFELRDENFKV